MIRISAITNIGLCRGKNQDGFFVNGLSSIGEINKRVFVETDESRIVAFVADGVGSTKDAEFAVEKAIKFSATHIEKIKADNLYNFFNQMNEFVNYCADKDGKKCSTTIAGVVVENEELCSYNVGDSKVFLINNGYLEQISIDDTAAGIFMNSDLAFTNDKIDTKQPIIQYIGNPNVNVIETHIKKALPIKDILLCTDGITDLVSMDEMEELLECSEDERAFTDAMISMALQRGGSDNATVIYIHFDKEV